MFDLVLLNLTTFVAIIALVFFMLLELAWPRIAIRKSFKSRILPITMFGIIAVFTGLFLSINIQPGFIALLKEFQIMSLAKSGLAPLFIFILAFLISDFLIYVFHWLSHKLSFLWRLHSIHHMDEQVTSMTGYLHHPLEVVASYVFMMFFYVVLGIPIIVVSIYVAINAAHNIFTHANIALSVSVDRILRFVIVTPDMHRTHHSIDLREGNSNFGQIFSFWDRLFGTYVDHPLGGEENLRMGLPEGQRPKFFEFMHLLVFPFRTK